MSLPSLRTAALNLGPYVFAAILLWIGYLRQMTGTRHPVDYHDFAYATLTYSDVAWLYIRDNLAEQPRPYLDYALEYPALLGGLSYLISFAPDGSTYFTLTYLVMALCALGTIFVLQRLPGADVLPFALAPTMLFYGGLNWDLAAIFMSALGLLAYSRRHDGWGTLALVAAIWLKFFPLAFLAAVLIERLNERRLRSALPIAGLFAVGSAVINLPLALANYANWSYFFTFNQERGAGSGLWVLFPNLSTDQVNNLSLAALLLGGIGFALLAMRARRPVLLPLSALLLLWWLFLNKVFSPQYALWVFLALALLRPAWSLWTAFAATDLAHYVVSFLILHTVRQNNGELVLWQNHYLRTPLELAREGILLIFIALAVRMLISAARHTTANPALATMDDTDKERGRIELRP